MEWLTWLKAPKHEIIHSARVSENIEILEPELSPSARRPSPNFSAKLSTSSRAKTLLLLLRYHSFISDKIVC